MNIHTVIPLIISHSILSLTLEDTGCPDGSYKLDDYCYSVSSWGETFERSELHCKMGGGTLAAVKNGEIHTFLQKIRLKNRMGYWIGLNDKLEEGKWVYSDGSKAEKFSKWIFGQPNNIGGVQDCATMRTAYNFFWDDDNCKDRYRYICQFASGNCLYSKRLPTLGNHCFVLSDKTATFDDAEAQCQLKGGFLVKVITESTHNFITDIIRNDQKWLGIDAKELHLSIAGAPVMWIGVRYETNKWVYSDGTVAKFTLWEPGQPNNAYNGQNCVAVKDMWWDDEECENERYFACQYEINPMLSTGEFIRSSVQSAGGKVTINIWNVLRNNNHPD